LKKILFLQIILKPKVMATFFKSSPVLYGKSAERFDREADKNKSLQTPTLSEEENEIFMQIFERSRNFKF
jgi:hypothetical protein